MDLCNRAQSLQFDINVPDLSAGSTLSTLEVRMQAAAVTIASSPANSVGVRFTGTVLSALVNVALFIHGNTGSEVTSGNLGTFTGGGTLHVTIANGNCSPTGSFTISVTGILGGNPQTISLGAGVPIVGDLDEFAIVDTVGTTGITTYLDGYDWQGSPIPAAGAPTISSVTPSSGPSGGGTSVTIAGTGFQSGATVNFRHRHLHDLDLHPGDDPGPCRGGRQRGGHEP